MAKIRILVADDHALVREGIIAILRLHGDLEVSAEAADGKEAIQKAAKLKPDIVLMDIAMPGLGGLEATMEIKKSHPEIKILVLSQYDDKEYVNRLLKAGVSGYILKHAVGTDLIAAIRAVARGESYLYPTITSSVIDDYLRKRDTNLEDPYDRPRGTPTRRSRLSWTSAQRPSSPITPTPRRSSTSTTGRNSSSSPCGGASSSRGGQITPLPG
jgi:DNA-binding NarL/FixJ family response regulator